MSAAPQRKVDRDELFEYIKTHMDEVGNIAISPSALAKEFNVATATMTHHLGVLTNQGKLVLTDMVGPQKKKVYRLGAAGLPKQAKLINPEENQDLIAQLRQNLRNYLPSGTGQSAQNNEIKKEPDVVEEPPAPQPEQEKDHTADTQQQEAPQQEEVQEQSSSSPLDDKEFQQAIIEREKSLDDEIRDYEARRKSSSAETILTKDDREILSIASESLLQFQIFFKDLTDQLSTVEDKRFIQSLLDERNRNLEEIQNLQSQVTTLSQAVNQITDQKGKDKESEQRAKDIYQALLYTIDTFVEQPAHAMYLNRTEFRKDIGDKIKELFLLSMRQN